MEFVFQTQGLQYNVKLACDCLQSKKLRKTLFNIFIFHAQMSDSFLLSANILFILGQCVVRYIVILRNVQCTFVCLLRFLKFSHVGRFVR